MIFLSLSDSSLYFEIITIFEKSQDCMLRTLYCLMWWPIYVTHIFYNVWHTRHFLLLKLFPIECLLKKIFVWWPSSHHDYIFLALGDMFWNTSRFISTLLEIQRIEYVVAWLFSSPTIIDFNFFRSIVLDYEIKIKQLAGPDRIFVGGALGNYSLAGFEMILHRHVSHYIINYYLPSGLFVVVSWISFLVPADIIPGIFILNEWQMLNRCLQ